MSGGLRVEAPGLLTTVQDLGRFGYGDLGVPPSGAADPLALRIGNRLVGNHESAAALEMTLVGGAFEFERATVLALTGSDFAARLGDADARAWRPFEARAGDVLRLGATRGGARAYLCVRGGIAVPPVMASASTHLLVGIGGFEGRPLRAGDRLSFGESVASAPALPRFDALSFPGLLRRDVLRVTPGPQSDRFPTEEIDAFRSETFRVTESSDRMGLRLEGRPIRLGSRRDLVTEGVCPGAVQVPPDGQPIVLLVEHPTTGGYPKIANVVSADLHVLGQLRPRDRVRFEPVTFEEAAALLREQEEALRALVD